MSRVGQHGSLYAWIVHLQQEGTRDACAFLQSRKGFEVFILLQNTQAGNARFTVHTCKQHSHTQIVFLQLKLPTCSGLTPVAGQFLMWCPVVPQR